LAAEGAETLHGLGLVADEDAGLAVGVVEVGLTVGTVEEGADEFPSGFGVV
jgi:hypothetical protein